MFTKGLHRLKECCALQQKVVDSPSRLNIMDSIAATHKDAPPDFK
jgi:hypothetical protein